MWILFFPHWTVCTLVCTRTIHRTTTAEWAIQWCFFTWAWTGPLACLSSVCLVDKGLVPRSGIGPLLVLFPQMIQFLSPLFNVTTVWNTGETGDINFCFQYGFCSSSISFPSVSKLWASKEVKFTQNNFFHLKLLIFI